jgi:N-acylneuraminate cytidylyltransferase
VIDASRVLALIPARGGSKGVPRKNIRTVGGRPLIAWTIAAARASRHVDRIILSSDDEEIMAVAKEYDCEVPYRRPAALAQDTTPGIEPVLHALGMITGYDVVVLLQPTSPLRTHADIDGCIAQLVSSAAPSVVSVTEAECHPYLTYELVDGSRLRSFVADRSRAEGPRQGFPPAWRLNGAVYAARVPWLLESNAFVGPGTVGYAMPAARSLDIDTVEDLALADAALSQIHDSSTSGKAP